MGARPRVLILGGGHAGVRCARELLRLRRSDNELEVVLVSRENVEVWHGLMPQIISGVLQAQHVLIPLREILPGANIYMYEIEAIDLASRKATLTRGGEGEQLILEFDHLVLALGSVTDLSRFPGLTEHGIQTKTIGDFIHLRNHLVAVLEAASVEPDQDERRRLLTVIVAGAGFAGIEIASEVNEFLRRALRDYPSLAAGDLRVVMVDMVSRILPAFQEALAERAVERLRSRGIELQLGSGVKGATAGGIELSTGERIETRTIIATVGIGTNPLISRLGVELVRGRVACDPFCRVTGWPNVYAIGDNGAIPSPDTGDPFPSMVLVAFSEGERAARNIIAGLRGDPLTEYRYDSFGEVALLSRGYGVAQLRGISLHGWPASLVCRLLFLIYMPTWRRRIALLLHWIGSALFPGEVTQLPLGRSDLIVPMRFGAGDLIVREGEIPSRFYIVTAGEVQVFTGSGPGERPLRRLGPGGSFGELALLRNGRRTASVRALTETAVLSIARQDFQTLAAHLPALRDSVNLRYSD